MLRRPGLPQLLEIGHERLPYIRELEVCSAAMVPPGLPLAMPEWIDLLMLYRNFVDLDYWPNVRIDLLVMAILVGYLLLCALSVVVAGPRRGWSTSHVVLALASAGMPAIIGVQTWLYVAADCAQSYSHKTGVLWIKGAIVVFRFATAPLVVGCFASAVCGIMLAAPMLVARLVGPKAAGTAEPQG